MNTPEHTKCAYQIVLDDFLVEYRSHIENYATRTGTSVLAVTQDVKSMLSLGANRMTNMTGCRHSDAMRSETHALKSMGIDKYTAAWNKERGL